MEIQEIMLKIKKQLLQVETKKGNNNFEEILNR